MYCSKQTEQKNVTVHMKMIVPFLVYRMLDRTKREENIHNNSRGNLDRMQD